MSAVDVTVRVERNAAGRHDYIVTTSTGYHATIPQCDRDECRDPGRYGITECRRPLDHRGQHEIGGSTSIKAWLRHAATRCHGWHDGRASDFAVAVRKTYGNRMPRAVTLLKGRPQRGPMSVDEVVDALGWITVDEYRAELAKAAA